MVFESAVDAVGCAVAAQQALCGHDWPGGVTVRVRIGLHSGEPVRHEDGYVGVDVHRAARIAAVAHGGQVVLSEATRLLVAARMPAGVSVRDLGFHQLKDIAEPERIYQLVADGLPERFPPLQSLSAGVAAAGRAGMHGFPPALTSFVGRQAELAEVMGLLAGSRLVTVTGPGGVGKDPAGRCGGPAGGLTGFASTGCGWFELGRGGQRPGPGGAGGVAAVEGVAQERPGVTAADAG